MEDRGGFGVKTSGSSEGEQESCCCKEVGGIHDGERKECGLSHMTGEQKAVFLNGEEKVEASLFYQC